MEHLTEAELTELNIKNAFLNMLKSQKEIIKRDIESNKRLYFLINLATITALTSSQKLELTILLKTFLKQLAKASMLVLPGGLTVMIILSTLDYKLNKTSLNNGNLQI